MIKGTPRDCNHFTGKKKGGTGPYKRKRTPRSKRIHRNKYAQKEA
jgi:hypothetical protein